MSKTGQGKPDATYLTVKYGISCLQITWSTLPPVPPWEGDEHKGPDRDFTAITWG